MNKTNKVYSTNSDLQIGYNTRIRDFAANTFAKSSMSGIIITTAILGTLFAAPAFAETNCQPIYGGGQTCVQQGNLLLNKTVQNPQSGSFVDNLSLNDAKYQPDQNVNFQISVTNTGGSTLSKTTVKDIFPQYVSYVSGPGSYDAKTKTLSFEVNDLKAGETRTFGLIGKVEGTSLPNDQTTCVVNQSSATVDGKTSQDNAQFCIQKQILGAAVPPVAQTTKGGLKVFPAPQVASTPPTGPELFSLIGLIPSAGLGFFLRKKSQMK